jgi:tetratricopeptide (TPR) repeat protein
MSNASRWLRAGTVRGGTSRKPAIEEAGFMRCGSLANAVAAAFCLLAASAAIAQQPAPADTQRIEVVAKKGDVSKWIRAESEHLVVYSDAREEDVTRLLNNLEKLDHLLRIYAGPARAADRQAPKLTLYFPARPSDLGEVVDALPADAVGLYSSCATGVHGFGVHLERIASLRDEQLEKSPLNDTLSYAFEAYARHFLYRHTDIRTPAWFIEGFAQYFSSVRFSEQQMVVGRMPVPIAQYLRFLDNGRRYSLEYEDVLENRVANARNYAGDAGVRLEFEAKSWLLTHYALSSEDRRKRLSRYLSLVGDGVGPTMAFERAFDVKASDIGKVMWRYGRGVEVLRVAHPALPAGRVSLRSLPRAADELIVLDAALKACPSRQAGELLLKKIAAVAARFPEDELARLSLGRAEIGWGDPRHALPPLNALLQKDDAGFEARYLLGVAHLRLAERHEGVARRDHLQAAQQHLERARSLNPGSVEAAFAALQADVAANDQPGSVALQAVISAWQSARDIDALSQHAALALAYGGNADEADQTLAPLAQDPRDEPMSRWAKRWQTRLEAGVTRHDILTELRRPSASDTPSREWTIDKDRVMQKVARNQGLEAAEPFIREMQRQNADPGANGRTEGTQRR